MIVVDVNVLSYLLIAGNRTVLARKVRHLDRSWHVPELWRHEFLNVLTTYVNRGGMDFRAADRLWQSAAKVLQRFAHSVDMRQSLALAVEYKISGYDAQYVTLAKSLTVPLVTEDTALQRTFPDLALSMQSFCAMRNGEVR